jgi:D-amino peptidase
VIRRELNPRAKLIYQADAYSAEIFQDLSAIACVGMHAAAGAQGFAAHTVALHCAWLWGHHSLSETEIVMTLAAEAGIPFIFASGDNVLASELAAEVNYIVTKKSFSATSAVSFPTTMVWSRLAQTATLPAVTIPPLPEKPLTLHFKSAWQATLAATMGADQLTSHSVMVKGKSFRERYQHAFAITTATEAPLAIAIRSQPGSEEFLQDIEKLLSHSFIHLKPHYRVEHLDRMLEAFLRLTSPATEHAQALRALTLHMLAGHAKNFFQTASLAQPFDMAMATLATLPITFPSDLSIPDAIARMDACYLRRLHSLPHPLPYVEEFNHYLEILREHAYILPAWLLAAMATRVGVKVENPIPTLILRQLSPQQYFYWQTHIFLLDSNYLQEPLSSVGREAEIEQLLLASDWLVREKQVDLAAEVAFCLQLVAEDQNEEQQRLLDLLTQHQQPDGSVIDPSCKMAPDIAHYTAAALIALAGAKEPH